VRRIHEDSIFQDLVDADDQLRFSRDDVLFINTLRHWPLRGVVRWIETLGSQRAPWVVLVLHFTAFPDPEIDDGTFQMYKEGFAAIEASSVRDRFVLFADSQELINEYRLATTLPVSLAPIPHSHRSCSNGDFAKADTSVTISYVGEARKHKGFHLLPHMVNGFARKLVNGTVHFNIQNFTNNPRDAFYKKAMAKFDSEHLTFFTEQMSEEDYQAYLSTSDIILVPYSLENYYKQTSGIFAEAMAMGKPTIVSRGTWMARQVKKYGGGKLFPPEDAEGLLNAAADAVSNFTSLRKEAQAAAKEWSRFHSPENFLHLVTKAIEERGR
jgi:glycosyltransferase involved in cell wall biosynthesis